MSVLATALGSSVQCGPRRPAAAPAASRLRISAFRPRLGALAASSSAAQAASARQRQGLLTVATYPEPETEKVRIARCRSGARRRRRRRRRMCRRFCRRSSRRSPPLRCSRPPAPRRSARRSTSRRSGSRRSPAAAPTSSLNLRSCRRRCPSRCLETQRCGNSCALLWSHRVLCSGQPAAAHGPVLLLLPPLLLNLMPEAQVASSRIVPAIVLCIGSWACAAAVREDLPTFAVVVVLLRMVPPALRCCQCCSRGWHALPAACRHTWLALAAAACFARSWLDSAFTIKRGYPELYVTACRCRMRRRRRRRRRSRVRPCCLLFACLLVAQLVPLLLLRRLVA